jgi:Fic family protein
MPKKRITGDFIGCSGCGEHYKAFVPKPLPPVPPLEITEDVFDLMERANRALGRLDGITSLLPDTYLFTYFYVRKEAVLSSQIEGTQSSLSQLLLFESEQAPGVPLDDVREVSNYVAAMDHGLINIRSSGGLPLSLRLLSEIHSILMAKGRGGDKDPGAFRQYQNWVGGSSPSKATFVPPPPDKVMACLSDLEKFLHDKPTRTPVLIKAALSHVQFETIHPFMDGNGRLGRLLVTLLLCAEEALKEPMLYLSLYFKSHRDEYYERLQKVRTEGDWEGWLRFFLTGVLETSQQAVHAAQSILTLFELDRRRIESLRQATSSVLRVHQYLQKRAVLSIGIARKNLELTKPTVGAAINQLEKLGIVREITGKGRNRLFIYDRYMEILDEGTKPIPKKEAE